MQLGLLGAALLAALVGVHALFGLPATTDQTAEMRIEPLSGTALVGGTFAVNVVVDSSVPVNVFSGELTFNSAILVVDSIDYNTSIADLWTETPWYSNGDGIIMFAGGTTKAGGFVGTGNLVTVTFRAVAEGEGALAVHQARILKHDGLGTDVSIREVVEAVFVVESEVEPQDNLVVNDVKEGAVQVVTTRPSTDLNGDGKQTMADLSIFLLHFTNNNPRSDFNLDGDVDAKDWSILLHAL
jgi:hypothetical protein